MPEVRHDAEREGVEAINRRCEDAVMIGIAVRHVYLLRGKIIIRHGLRVFLFFLSITKAEDPFLQRQIPVQ